MDPSGNIVSISDFVQVGTRNINSYTVDTYVKDFTLKEAWDLFKSVAPDVAATLEESDKVIHIMSYELGGGKNGMTGGNYIAIDIDLVNEGVEAVTCTLAHETVHATLNVLGINSGSSIYEEAVAFRFGEAVSHIVGYDPYDYYGCYGW